MLTNTTKWSHAAGNHVVPSRWQATTPARAGTTIPSGGNVRDARDDPRSRGDDVRGECAGVEEVRMTPARAGTTPPGRGSVTRCPDDPRSRGDDFIALCLILGLAG